MIKSDYLAPLFDGETLHNIVKNLSKEIRKFGLKNFDAIAFRGTSGAVIASSIAANLKKNLIVVRKEKSPHSAYFVEGEDTTQRYIIIDDFIATGTTLETIERDIRVYLNTEAKPVAVFLYKDYDENKLHSINNLKVPAYKFGADLYDKDYISTSNYKVPLKY